MMTITPISFNQKSKSIPFEKSRKEIINDASNKELKKIVKDAVASHNAEIVLDWGLPELINYAKRGETQKREVVCLLKDMIESEELQTTSTRQNLFYGYGGDGELDTGYLGTYEKLTGTRLNVNV